MCMRYFHAAARDRRIRFVFAQLVRARVSVSICSGGGEVVLGVFAGLFAASGRRG